MFDLSIIIVNWNTKGLIRKCLYSVNEEMGKPFSCEVIVVDNASEDGSVDYLKRASGNFDFTFKLIENRNNLGFAKAVNQGLRIARAKTVLLLNSDTHVQKGFFNNLLEFEKKVTPAIIGVKFLNPDGSVQASVFHLPTIKGAILEYWLRKKASFSKYTPKTDKPVEVEAVSGGGMLISGKILEEVGLLDERFFFYFEDLEFCRRARRRGYKIFYFPFSQLVHEHGASGRSIADFGNQWRRLVPSSKIYHGLPRYYLINFIIWIGQKWQRISGKKSLAGLFYC